MLLCCLVPTPTTSRVITSHLEVAGRGLREDPASEMWTTDVPSQSTHGQTNVITRHKVHLHETDEEVRPTPPYVRSA